jgi:hypothetical protein
LVLREGEPVHSDRGAWNNTDYPAEHARDISDAALIHHLPEPSSAGEIVQSDGSTWSATPITAFVGDIVTFEDEVVVHEGDVVYNV